MASIITVHGTGDTQREDAGKQWWQKESPFAEEIHRLVESADGSFGFHPFHWTGANSETDRRSEGERLYKHLLSEFEEKNLPYHLIGHSHGGSVIKEALLQATLGNTPLNNLRSWVTVGTPFLSFRKSWGLFSKLGLVGRALFIFSLMYLFAIIFPLFSNNCHNNFGMNFQCWSSSKSYSVPNSESFSTVSKVTMQDPYGEQRFERLRRWGEVVRTETGLEFSPHSLLIHDFTWDIDLAENVEPSDIISESAKIPVLSDTTYNLGARFLLISQHAPNDRIRPPLFEVASEDKSLFLSTFLHSERAIDICINENLKLIREDARDLVNAKFCNESYSVTREDRYDLWDELPGPIQFSIWKDGRLDSRFSIRFTHVSRDGKIVLSAERDIPNPLVNNDSSFLAIVLFILAVSLPIVLMYLVGRFAVSIGRRRELFNTKLYLSEKIQSQWICLSHRDDEVINAIENSTKVKTDLAPKKLLSGTLATSISVLVVSMFFLTHLPASVFYALFGELLSSDNDSIAQATNVSLRLLENPLYALENFYVKLTGIVAGHDFGNSWERDLVLVVFGFIFLVLILLIVLRLSTFLEKVLVPKVRDLFNRSVDVALRSTAFGHDVRGEVPSHASVTPDGSERIWRPLNGRPADAMHAHVKGKVDNLVARFRLILGLAEDQDDEFDLKVFYNAVTWDELIHTSYFNVDEIQKMIAAALIRTGDFRPSAQFVDFSDADGWLSNIRGYGGAVLFENLISRE
ncbi:MAG: hypothetical protein P8H62_02025 [Henriciella sp.]|nr:hypothetical protein [Henriciella sp.]